MALPWKTRRQLQAAVKKHAATIDTLRAEIRGLRGDCGLVERERAEWQRRAERIGNDRIASENRLRMQKLANTLLGGQVAAQQQTIGELRADLADVKRRLGELEEAQAGPEAAGLVATETKAAA